MRTLLLITLGGAIAQLVDGSLGMGFGATSTTLLITLAAMTPASASAVVHVAELGTTAASGLSHWKFGNVDWKVALQLGIPGAAGAFLGATVLSNLTLNAAKPVTSTILLLIGLSLIIRFSRGRRTTTSTQPPASRRSLTTLGLFGGFVDAAGGGGWGPVTSSTLMSIGKTEPRRIVGTVNTAEFLVTLAASLGFILGLWSELVEHFSAVLALLTGGVIAAPFAAWLVSRINATALGGFVGTTLVLLNLSTILKLLPALEPWTLPIYLTVAILGITLSALGVRRSRALTNTPPTSYSEQLPSPEKSPAGSTH